MHITLLALGSRGDVLPYVALGRGLKSSGHSVRMITFESFASMISEQGLELHPIAGDARALTLAGGSSTLGMVRSFTRLATGYARDLSDPRLGETDLIVNQLPGGLYGFDLAEKYHLPMMLASVIPLARTRTLPLMGFPKLPLPGYNQLTYRLGEQTVWGMFRGVINRWRRGSLHLPPQPLGGTFDQMGTHKVPILNGFSRHVVSRPADWGEHIHLTGYWFPEQPEWQPPKDLLDFLDAGNPPVFIGFGSMPVKDPLRTTAIILEALHKSGQRGILHTGWGGFGNQPLSKDVFQIEYAPYGWLFPRTAMIFHHGGSGTTAHALRSGIPSCAVPLMFDQAFWGRQTAAAGAGPAPIPFKRLSADHLQRAIEQGVHDARMRQSAAHLGNLISSENGIETAVRIIMLAIHE